MARTGIASDTRAPGPTQPRHNMKKLLAFVCACALVYGPFVPMLSAQWMVVLSGSTPVAGGFNPQTQGTLVNWYDASTLGLANGANVVTFTDSKTGHPNPLTTSAFNPTYATNQQNGLSVVSFVGASGQYFTTGGSNASTFPYTVAAIIKVPSPADWMAISGSSATGGVTFQVNGTAHLQISKAGTGGIATSTGTFSTSSYHLVVYVITSTTYSFYIDGAAAGSGSHSQTLTGGCTFTMGSDGGSGTLLTGYIGEVQIYSSVLSGSDLSALHSWAVSKWATP